jgi:hypothetical protein
MTDVHKLVLEFRAKERVEVKRDRDNMTEEVGRN